MRNGGINIDFKFSDQTYLIRNKKRKTEITIMIILISFWVIFFRTTELTIRHCDEIKN